MELLIRSLKEEIEFDVDKYIDNYKIDDYDEIFEDWYLEFILIMKEKKMLKMLKKALKEEHLYSNDELVYMKRELKNLENQFQELRKLTNKGFGN